METRQLKVGLVARCLNTAHIRGMGRYVYELLAQSSSSPGIRWMLFGQNALQSLAVPPSKHIECDFFDVRGDRFHMWEQWGLPRRARRHGLDLLHCTEGSMCLWQPLPTVITLHDTLMWDEHADDPISKIYWRHLMPAALRRAAAVITISESSRHDILARWPELNHKLTVIPHGIDPSYFAPDTPALSPAISDALAGSPYLIYMGGPLTRKRFAWAIEVLKATSISELKLVACGFGTEARLAAIEALPAELRSRVHFATFLSDDELRGLYKRARAALYPTLYEGFGFPAVEAQAAGVPVIFSPLGSLKELNGPLATVVAHDDLPAWVAAVDWACALSEAARADLAMQASIWSRRFDWSKSLERHLEVYSQVANLSRA